jgi:putative FmdB family regulatory protein
MPTYAYRCPQCGRDDEVLKPMTASNTVETCRQCGAVMNRDYMAEGVHTSADSYNRELHSDALAIHPSQRAEHERRYPDVPLDAACRPILQNYRQHSEYLEARGVVKPSSRKEII